MSKLKEKWVDWGTGSGQVSSRSVPANYTPSSYTPEQAGSEGTDKVSAHLKGIDTKFSTIVTGEVIIETFTAGAGGQTTFDLVTDILAADKIKVWINGYLQLEGAGEAYTLDYDNDQVIFTETVPEGSKVRVDIATTG